MIEATAVMTVVLQILKNNTDDSDELRSSINLYIRLSFSENGPTYFKLNCTQL